MPKLDIESAPVKTGSIYPEPYASQMAGRSSQRLGELAGLSQFGVNIVTLQPGAVASLRHWHLKEDEFAIVLDGNLVLVEDNTQAPMAAGDCAAWKPVIVPRGRRGLSTATALKTTVMRRRGFWWSDQGNLMKLPLIQMSTWLCGWGMASRDSPIMTAASGMARVTSHQREKFYD